MSESTPRTVRCRVDELDRLRQARGWTWEQLALKAGIHARTLERVRANDEHRVYLSTLAQIAKAFGTSPGTLNADRNDQESESPIRFDIRIRIKGSFSMGSQKEYLQQLTPEILQRLSQHGITIKGQQSALNTSRMNKRLLWRAIVAVAGVTDERACWVIAAMQPARLQGLLNGDASLGDNGIPADILDWGWGRCAPRSAIDAAAGLIECDPSRIVDLSHEQVEST